MAATDNMNRQPDSPTAKMEESAQTPDAGISGHPEEPAADGNSGGASSSVNMEFLLDIPLEDCILRDTRGVYSSGVDVVGLDLPFEKPRKSDLIICDPQLSSIEIAEMALRLMEVKNGK